MRRATFWGLLFVLVAAPSQASTIYTFAQTGAFSTGFAGAIIPQPNYDLDASLTFADGFGFKDLPTLSCRGGMPSSCPEPFDYFPLLALSVDIHSPVRPAPFRLNPDFLSAPTVLLGFPLWFISPSGIDFIDRFDGMQFTIAFAAGTIAAASDAGLTGCTSSGRCTATGGWEIAPAAVPEPASFLLLAFGLIGAVIHRRRGRPHVVE